MSKTDPHSPKFPAGHSNGSAPSGSPKSAAISAPMRLIEQNERAAQGALGEDEILDENTALALFESQSRADGRAPTGGNGAIESADDASLREFYSQLVTLLTQDNTAQETRKKSRNGLLVALRRRWLPALLTTALVFFGLVQALRPRDVSFQASATLLLPPREARNSRDPLTMPEDSYDTRAQLAIFSSEAIVSLAMSKVPPRLRKRGWDNAKARKAPVQVNSQGGSDSLISISASSRDAEASWTLVNEMVTAYTDYVKNRYNNNRDQNLSATETRVKNTRKKLDAARDELRRFKEQTGISNPLSAQSASASAINSLESQLSDARNQAVMSASDDPNLNSLRQDALVARAKYDDVLRVYFPDSPEARTAEREWRRAQDRAETRSAQIVRTSQARISQLETSLSEAKRRGAGLPAAEQTLNRLNERVSLLETAYRSATELYNELDLERGTVAQTAKILQSPTVGSDRTVKWVRALAVSLVGALGLGLLSALLFDRLDHSVRAVGDPEALFSAPVLGAMPAVNSPRSLIMGNAANSGGGKARTATIEACYATQNNLLAAARAAGARSILVTSSLPEEGKSQCAANLATAMAYGGRQVVLVDVDFWHPTQHEIFQTDKAQLELEPGYAQVLCDGLPLSQSIRPTTVPNLHLLGAGKKVGTNSPEATEMITHLSGPHHRETMEVLKRYFDVVVVDGPPAMGLADAQLLSGVADALLLVAADGTSREQVKRARSMLRLSGCVLLGVVINSVRMSEVNRWNLDFTPEEPFSDYGDKSL